MTTATPTSRLQLALDVPDVDAAVDFYTRLFGVEPHKRRPGYANFAVADPPLKLVLFERADATAATALNHLGVELAGTDDVVAATRRLEEAGLPTRTSTAELCCHAVQDKVFVDQADVPTGEWELYAVVDDEPEPAAEQQTAAQAQGCC